MKGYSQNSMGVGTTNPNPNAVLELVSPTGDQGFLVPRYTAAQRTDPAFTSKLTDSDNGLMVFDTDDGNFYFWFSGAWQVVANAGGTGDMLQSVYDTNIDGMADSAAYALDAETVSGLTVETSVPTGAIFTDSQDALSVSYDPISSGLAASDVQGAIDEIAIAGGDMIQSVYDADGNNVVDDAEMIGGLTVETSVPAGAVFTDNQTAAEVSVVAEAGITATDVQAALAELQGEISSGGDMLQSVYDVDANNKVDVAEAADSLSTDFLDGITLAYGLGALEVRDNGISSVKIANGAVTSDKLSFLGSEGQPLVYASGSWQPAAVDWLYIANVPADLADGDDVGIMDLTSFTTDDLVQGSTNLYYTDAAVTSLLSTTPINTLSDVNILSPAVGQVLQYDGADWVAGTISSTVNVDGTTILGDGDVTPLAIGTVDPTSISTFGAVMGDVLTYDGIDWIASPPVTGVITDGTTILGDGEGTPISIGTVDPTSLSTAGAVNGDVLTYDGIDWIASPPVTGVITDGTTILGDGEGTPLSVNTGIGADLIPQFDGVGDIDLGAGTVTAAFFSGDGSGLTGVTATTLSGSFSGDVTGTQSATVVSLIGGETAANVASATATVNGAPNLDTDASDDVLLNTALPAGDITGDFTGGMTISAGAVSGGPGGDIADGTITDDDIAAGAAIEGTKINPDFGGQNIVTTGTITGDGSGLTNLNVPVTEDAQNNLYAGTLSGNALTSGTNNVLYGRSTGSAITTESNNTAVGWLAGFSLTSTSNSVFGYRTGVSTTTGTLNSFFGVEAGQYNVTGSNNVGIGNNAGPANGFGAFDGWVAIGALSIVNSNYGVALGYGSFVNAENAVAIGANVNAETANTIILGDGQVGSAYDVGIGTNTPSSRLEVNGVVTATGFSGDGSALTNTGPWTGTTDIVYTGGNVGIGVDPPTEALDVNGSVQVSGTGDFKYASAKTYIYAVTPADFRALLQTGSEDYRVRTGTTGIEAMVYSATNDAAAVMGAPVHLPNDAVITRIDVVGRNTSTTNAAEVNFVEKSYSTAQTSNLVTTIPVSTTAVTTLSNTSMNITINNNLNNYLIKAQAWTNNASITGIKIFYQVTKAD